MPDVFGVRENHRDELLQLILVLTTLRLLIRDLRRLVLEDDAGIDAQREADQDGQHGHSTADRDAPAAASGRAAILDVIAFALSLPFHGSPPEDIIRIMSAD